MHAVYVRSAHTYSLIPGREQKTMYDHNVLVGVYASAEEANAAVDELNADGVGLYVDDWGAKTTVGAAFAQELSAPVTLWSVSFDYDKETVRGVKPLELSDDTRQTAGRSEGGAYGFRVKAATHAKAVKIARAHLARLEESKTLRALQGIELD